jgi:hypothetical protein
MPEIVTVDGKQCIEYSITELEAIRNAQLTREYLRRGPRRTKQSVFNNPVSINPTGRKPRLI